MLLLLEGGIERKPGSLLNNQRQIGRIEPFVRRQTWVARGSEKDRRMQALLDEWLVQAEDGTWELSIAEPLRVGLVAWEPAARV